MKSFIASIIPVIAAANYTGYGGGSSTYGGYGSPGYSTTGYAGTGYGSQGYGNYGAYQGFNEAASIEKGAAAAGYDVDVWSDKIYGEDFKSSWGRSYDLVEAQQFDDEQYTRELDADDD